jgi:hypothetical protein
MSKFDLKWSKTRNSSLKRQYHYHCILAIGFTILSLESRGGPGRKDGLYVKRETV